MLHIYKTCVCLAVNFWWQFGEDRLLMEAHFQLNVITNVLQAVCGCLDAVTAYTHKLDLELWCVFSQEMMPQLKMSCPLPKCNEVGFLRSIFSCHFIFLFSDSVSDHPHLPFSQHFFPHKFRGRIYVFLLYKINILSICLAWSPPHLAPCQSPLEKSCFEGMSLKQQQDCNAFDSVIFDSGLSSAGDSGLNYRFS